MTDRKNVIFDSTILNSIQDCAEKNNLSHNQDLRPVERKTYFEEGDLLHNMFEFYNLVLRDTRTEILYDNEKYDDLLKAIADYGQWYSVQKELLPSEASEVIFQFNAYANHTRMDGVTVLEVEKPFTINLYKDDELGVYYTGKIDRYTDTPPYGLVARDYKSGGQRGKPKNLSNQFTSYCYAMNSELIIVDKVGFQKTLKPEQRFEHHPLYYNAFKKEQWKKDTIWWARLYAFYIETNTWPRNRTGCDKWGGCDFVPVCDANDEETRQHLLKTLYVIGDHWDVSAVLEKDKDLTNRQKMSEIAGNYGIDLRIV